MIPAGYMAKRVQKPKGFHVDSVVDVYSVSPCMNEDFADYIQYWKHNGYCLLDSPEISGVSAGTFHSTGRNIPTLKLA
jgi:hypothetical protein